MMLSKKKYKEIEKYIKLITCFVKKNINAEEFHVSYLKMYLDETTLFQDERYTILNELFYDVEEYTPLVHLREDGDIDDVGLLESAKIALEKLNKL